MAPAQDDPDTVDPEAPLPTRSLRERPWFIIVSTAVSAAAILTLYFIVPLAGSEFSAIERLLGAGVVLVVLITALLYMRRRASNLPVLVIVLVLVAVAFAATFYVIAADRPSEFDGIETRIDALYFTLTTMTTTGYGDIHAVGQLSRVLVSAVFVFDVLFLSLVAAEASRIVTARRERKTETSA